MTDLAAWLAGSLLVAGFGIVTHCDTDVARDLSIGFAGLVLTAWLFLVIRAERKRRAQRR